MLMPKRTKYRKPFRPRKNRGKAQRGTDINFGEYGLQVIEPAMDFGSPAGVWSARDHQLPPPWW